MSLTGFSTCKYCGVLISKGPGEHYWRDLEGGTSLTCSEVQRGNHEPSFTPVSAPELRRGVVVREHRTYLVKRSEVVPILATVAFIIMACLEIAWHT